MARSPHLLIAYYQQMPPYVGGTAMRGISAMLPLTALWRDFWQNHATPQADAEPAHCEVLTMVGQCPSGLQLSYKVLTASEVTNKSRLVVRLLGELLMGLRASLHVLRKGPACVVLSSPGYWPCVLIAAVCRMRRIPYVLDVRDLYPEVYAHSGLMTKKSLIYGALLGLSRQWYRGAAGIAVATRGLKLVVEPMSRTENNTGPDIAVVYNGFPASLLQIRPTKHARFTVVFHGVLGFFQDITTLCLMAEHLLQHDIDVVVIGYGKKEGQLQSCALPNLRFLGRMTHAQTMQTVAQCHLGLCLRLDDDISKDAFPVKVWEYLGLAMPCIVTPRCEAGEFLEHHGCGIQLASGDIAALAAAILRFRDKPRELANMSEKCNQAVDGYTREHTGEQLARFVIRTLDQK